MYIYLYIFLSMPPPVLSHSLGLLELYFVHSTFASEDSIRTDIERGDTKKKMVEINEDKRVDRRCYEKIFSCNSFYLPFL